MDHQAALADAEPLDVDRDAARAHDTATPGKWTRRRVVLLVLLALGLWLGIVCAIGYRVTTVTHTIY